MAGKVAELWVQIGAKIDSFEKGISDAERAMQRVGKKFSQIGKKLTTRLSLPIAGVGIASIKMSTDFNKAMSNVATLIPGNIKRVEELKRNVQDMAMATGKGTGDIAEGLYEVVSAFGDASDTAKKLDINVRAGAAGMATTIDAMKLTSAVTKGYGNTTAEAVQKAADLAFMTVKLGQTTFPELGYAIKGVIPLAAQLKLKQEELFTTFATLTGVTGNATEVSTQFSGILRSMIKPTDDMKKAIQKVALQIGLEKDATAESIIQKIGFKKTLEGLVSATDGTTRGIAKLFVRVEGLTGLLPLTSSLSETYNKKLKEITDSSGALDEAFKEISEGINKTGFNMARLKQMVIVLAQKFGDELAPALGKTIVNLQSTVKSASKLVEVFGKMPEPIKASAIAFAGLLVAVGPAIFMLGQLTLALPMISKLASLMTKSIIGARAGFIAAAGGAGILLGALGGLVYGWYKVKEAQDKAIESEKRANEAQITLNEKLKKASDLAGLTTQEFLKLTKAYNYNNTALAMAIYYGKEGKELQEALKKVGKEHAEEIRGQTSALDESKFSLEEWIKNADIAAEKTRTWDERLKELALMTIPQKLEAIVALEEEMAKIDQMYKDGQVTVQDYTRVIEELRQKIIALKVGIEYEVAPTMRSWVTNELAPLIDTTRTWGEETKKATEKVAISLETVNEVWNDVVMKMGESLMDWGEMSGNIFKNVGKIFAGFIQDSIKGIGRLVIAELLASKKEWLLAKTTAIAKGIASVFKKVPFPLNIAAAAAIIGTVSALFSKIAKFGEGGIAWKPQLAIVGEKGPEKITPLKDIARERAVGGMESRPSVYITYAPVIQAMDSQDVYKFMIGRGREAMEKMLKGNIGGFTRRIKEETGKV